MSWKDLDDVSDKKRNLIIKNNSINNSNVLISRQSPFIIQQINDKIINIKHVN